MRKDDQFDSDMQGYMAVTTVGSSALRNQGSKGVIKAARTYHAGMGLSNFRVADEAAFLRELDSATEELKAGLPPGAQNWGAARKALNLFLRDTCYNRFLCEPHGPADSEEWMELPFDSLVALVLKRKGECGELPPWPGLNGLTGEISSRFQSFAKQVANAQGISRVHLDMRLWTSERERDGKMARP